MLSFVNHEFRIIKIIEDTGDTKTIDQVGNHSLGTNRFGMEKILKILEIRIRKTKIQGTKVRKMSEISQNLGYLQEIIQILLPGNGLITNLSVLKDEKMKKIIFPFFEKKTVKFFPPMPSIDDSTETDEQNVRLFGETINIGGTVHTLYVTNDTDQIIFIIDNSRKIVLGVLDASYIRTTLNITERRNAISLGFCVD